MFLIHRCVCISPDSCMYIHNMCVALCVRMCCCCAVLGCYSVYV